MDPIDLEIRRRLDKLKEPLTQIPSEEELHARLKILKDVPSPIPKLQSKYVLLPKPKSTVEQVEDLMKQYSAETALPNLPGPSSSGIEEIEQRLKNLKSDQVSSSPFKNEMEPKESENKRFLKKILAEAALEKRTESKFPNTINNLPEQMEYSDNDGQDEFCYICDEVPQWICSSCDDNVFCTKCFQEYHNEIDEYHKRKKITLNRKKDSDSDYSD